MEEGFELTKVERAVFSRAAAKRVPVYGGFELTPYCNLACKMCYVRETAPGLPVLSGNRWLDFGRQAAQAGTLCVALSGGEPLIHPDFRQIYAGLKKMGMVLTINTNGTLIDESMADFLAADMPRRVNVSLYGSNEEAYEKLCGDAGAFSKTIRAIELMRERGIPVKINITPTTINYPYLDDMLAICKRYDLTVEMALYVFEPIRKAIPGRQLYRLDPQRMAIAHEKWNRSRYTEEQMLIHSILCYEGLEHFDASRQLEGTLPIQCSAGVSGYCICWDGKMNPCTGMLSPRADVAQLGFAEAWEAVKKESDRIRVPAKCRACSLKLFCMNCAAISFHNYGVFDRTPEVMCQATQEYAKNLAKHISGKHKRGEKHETEEKP